MAIFKKRKQYITSSEIIKEANIHPQTLVHWRRRGWIVPIDKIGPAFLYDRDAVMSFIKKRKEKKSKRKNG